MGNLNKTGIDHTIIHPLSGHANLLDLAMDCPDKHADASYIARSLLRADSTRWHYNDADLCTTLYPRSVESSELKSFPPLFLKPNPANDVILIDRPEEDAELLIIDIHGKVLYKSRIADDEARISTADWPSGLYTVLARTRSGSIYASTFIKL